MLDFVPTFPPLSKRKRNAGSVLLDTNAHLHKRLVFVSLVQWFIGHIALNNHIVASDFSNSRVCLWCESTTEDESYLTTYEILLLFRNIVDSFVIVDLLCKCFRTVARLDISMDILVSLLVMLKPGSPCSTLGKLIGLGLLLLKKYPS